MAFESPHPIPVIVSFSGGKDSILALYTLLQSRQYRVVGLLTSVNATYDRVTMQGIRRILVQQQARAIGIPLTIVELPDRCSNEEYETRMRNALARFRTMGVRHCAFGDIFLEDVRRYREERLLRGGWQGVFPLWGRNTRYLAEEFLRLGFRAVVTCVDGHVLDASFVGRALNRDFLRDLPPDVDPCGEKGEFHTFVYDGPLFVHPIRFRYGPVVLRERRFYYCDLIPEET